jgi:hypothetical protein
MSRLRLNPERLEIEKTEEADRMISIEEKIGEGLIRIGAMKRDQVEQVLQKQKAGDARLFGEIAVELGFVDVDAIISYLDAKKDK